MTSYSLGISAKDFLRSGQGLSMFIYPAWIFLVASRMVSESSRLHLISSTLKRSDRRRVVTSSIEGFPHVAFVFFVRRVRLLRHCLFSAGGLVAPSNRAVQVDSVFSISYRYFTSLLYQVPYWAPNMLQLFSRGFWRNCSEEFGTWLRVVNNALVVGWMFIS